MRKLALSLAAIAMLAGPALAADTSVSDNDKPDATLQLTGGAVAAGIGYTWGHGTLTYGGAARKFSISGVSIVDAGVADISAKGNVYHLTKVEDFAGNYVAVTAGATVAGGGSAALLKNEHGVYIKLTATTVGLRFTLSANGVAVRLKS